MIEKKVLVCVSGLSPQIITETVYALAVHKQWIPDEIRLITTTEGKERARLGLLSDQPGWFKRLQNDFALPEIGFSKADIKVIEDAQGSPLDDIRSVEDNQAAADFIVEQIRDLTAQKNTLLHVSIAGGRKTMGFYVGYALSLFGRPKDRLSHVLVNAPFESSWDFFYPTPYANIIQTNNQALADTQNAQVTLAEIPFVRLRNELPEKLLSDRVSYHKAIDVVDASLASPYLKINQLDKQVITAHKRLHLSPASLALLSVFAREKIGLNRPLYAPSKDVPDRQWGELYLSEYRSIKGEMGGIEVSENAFAKGMDGDQFSCAKSKLHRELKQQLGKDARHYVIDDGASRPRRYQLTLTPEQVDIK